MSDPQARTYYLAMATNADRLIRIHTDADRTARMTARYGHMPTALASRADVTVADLEAHRVRADALRGEWA